MARGARSSCRRHVHEGGGGSSAQSFTVVVSLLTWLSVVGLACHALIFDVLVMTQVQLRGVLQTRKTVGGQTYSSVIKVLSGVPEGREALCRGLLLNI